MIKQRKASLVLAVLLLVLAAGIGGCTLVQKRAEVEVRAAERIGILCATEGGNCVESWNGSDIYIYSDAGSTQKFHVDGATGNIDSEGTLGIAGNVDFETANLSSSSGAVTVTDNVFIDGQADANQLRVQGYTTQTSNLLELEDSTSEQVFSVAGGGNTTISGTLTISGAINDSDSTYLTLSDGMLIDGQTDVDQLTVQGAAEQANDLLVLENAAADEVFIVAREGATTISSTLTLTDTLTVNNQIILAGASDEDQLTITGYAEQANDLLVLENAAGDEVVIFAREGATTFSSTVTLTDTLTVNNQIALAGASDEDQLVVRGYSEQANDLLVLENAAYDEVFVVAREGATAISGTLAVSGTLSDADSALTVADNFVVTGQADADQVTITGYTEQANDLLILENAAGDEVVIFAREGATTISSTLTLTDTLTVNNQVAVVGASDEDQVTITGYSEQANDLLVLENVAGDEVVIFAREGATTISSTLTLTDTLTVNNQIALAGASDEDQLTITGYAEQANDLLVLENAAGDEVVIFGREGGATFSSTLTLTDTLTVNNQIALAGASDEDQLVVRGYAEQANDLLVLENAAYDEVFVVAREGATTISGTLAISGTLSDADSALTVADNVMVDGAADADQLTVQGYSEQANDLLVLENAAADEVFIVAREGATTISSTLTLTDTLTVNNNVSIDGTADEDQLVVQGYAEQAGDLLVLENAAADEVLIVAREGATTISSTLTTTGTVTVGAFQVFDPETLVTVTANDEEIVCLGTYCRITAGAARYTDDIATQPEGTLLILINMGSNNITITDTSPLSLSATVALGQHDTLTLVSDGTGWIEIGVTNI